MSVEMAELLGHEFTDPSLLALALTHSSLGKEHKDNERLEFLGDRVLGLVVARMLFQRFSDEDEGALARRHAALVRKETLVLVAREIGLGEHLALSGSESAEKEGILADACEAVLGALYLDGGMVPAEQFILRHWAALMEKDLTPPKDAKTALQEWAQARGLGLPVYTEKARQGPPHNPVFTIEASLSSGEAGEAVGPSKRLAEQKAAEALLEKLS